MNKFAHLPLTHKTRREETYKREIIRFGLTDSKGREIGCRVATSVCEFIAEEGLTYGWRREPGVYFCANVHATRNGVEYGASQSDEFFKTEDERDAYVLKRIADSRKRAIKLAK